MNLNTTTKARMLIPALALSLSACSYAPKKATETSSSPTARCQEQPTWTVRTSDGRLLGVYVCFGEQNALLYTTRILPEPPATPASSPAAPAPKKTSRRKAAR